MNHIRLKCELPSLNEYINAERRNRFIAAKMKKTSQEAVEWQLKTAQPIIEPSYFHFHWSVRNRRKDPDNVAAFGHKIIFDALQATGKLPNDNMQWVVGIADTFSIGDEGVIISIIPLTEIKDGVIIPVMKENQHDKKTPPRRIAKQINKHSPNSPS